MRATQIPFAPRVSVAELSAWLCRNVSFFMAKKGANFALERTKMATELTPEMIKNGSWKTTPLKPYNFNSMGQPLDVRTPNTLPEIGWRRCESQPSISSLAGHAASRTTMCSDCD